MNKKILSYLIIFILLFSFCSVFANQLANATIVYWTPKGRCYHIDRDCRTLSRSRTIYSGTIQESGRRPCKVCTSWY